MARRQGPLVLWSPADGRLGEDVLQIQVGRGSAGLGRALLALRRGEGLATQLTRVHLGYHRVVRLLLICTHQVRGSAIGKQVRLLLDAVCHLAAAAVPMFVELPRRERHQLLRVR